MKKLTFTLIMALLIFGGYFAFESFEKGFIIANLLSKDLRIVSEYSLSFLEDLKFKDFVKAAKYHSNDDQKKVNIPRLIERIFQIKPEFLDVLDYKILETSLDSSGNRARVKLRAKVHVLNSEEIRKPEIILYYHKKNGKWFMELESSLSR